MKSVNSAFVGVLFLSQAHNNRLAAVWSNQPTIAKFFFCFTKDFIITEVIVLTCCRISQETKCVMIQNLLTPLM